MSNYVPIFAHRGASAYAFENSIEALNEALVLQADGVEIDIQCSKDNILFVFHDLNLKRLADINKNIVDCTAEELKGYRLGRNFLRRFSKRTMPTFEEVISWALEHRMPINVELKESLVGQPTSIIEVLKIIQLPDGSHFSSFHNELLQLVKKHRPEFETALIITKKFNWEELHLYSHIDTIHAHKKYYKTRFLKACENANKNMRFYGITGEENYIEDPHPIVTGWITDYPDRLAKKQNRQ
ncbi:glycerophosphodiester phosphodiesterase [Lysinibacillus sp. 54212]|uniref:glycerophosphodiester phosphodiesterase n=1 Tax=Lysinibacillus sp. 54212 TaxID=3119829 RepID=UPI002FC8BCF9